MLRLIAAILAAYAVGCTVVVVIWHVTNRHPFTVSVLAADMSITAIYSAPGFVMLRLLLWAARQRNPVVFALAGAINGLLALALCIREIGFDPYFAMMGLAAGTVYWLVERAIAVGILMRREAQTG